MGSVSKKAKKEVPADSGCGSPDTESELPSEDDSKYPEDLEDKMKGEAGRQAGSSHVPQVCQLIFMSCPPCSVQQPSSPGEEDGVGEAGGSGGHPEERGVWFRPGPAAGCCPLHHQAVGGEGSPGEELHEERLSPDHPVRNHRFHEGGRLQEIH